MRSALIWATMLTVAAACGGGGSGTASQPTTATRIRGPADLITEAEIKTGDYNTALDAVRNLRPNMLMARGVGADPSGMLATTIPIIVYMDDVRLGEVGSLTTIPADRVKEIRFMNSRDATTRYGTGHSSGVILVTTKR